MAKRKKEEPSPELKALYKDREKGIDLMGKEEDKKMDSLDSLDMDKLDNFSDSEVDLGDDTFVSYSEAEYESDDCYDIELLAEENE